MHDFTLEELLSGLPSDEFAWVADYYGVLWNKSSKTRKRAISGITRQILDIHQLFDEAVLLDHAQWAQFLRIRQQPLLMEDEPPAFLVPFLEMGYLFDVQMPSGDIYLVIPREIRRLLDSNEWKQLEQTRDQVSELFLSATAAVNLYGVIEMQEFIDIYNKMFGRNVDLNMALDALVDFDMNEVSDFVFWREYIVHATFEEDDFDGVLDLLYYAENKPRYIPDKHVFMCYARPYYMENSIASDNMLAFLKGKMQVEEQEARILLIELHMLCAANDQNNQMQKAINLLDDCGVAFSARTDLTMFNELFVEMINNTRMWHNKGHTPNEIKQIMDTDDYPKPGMRRPGRNEDCPCGSGKKYKDCCGKRDNIIAFPGTKN